MRTPDDPTAPLIQLERADDHGESAAVVLDTIVGSANEILRCWELAVASGAQRGSVGIQVRRPSGPQDDLLRVDVGQDAGPELKHCVDAAVREHLPTPDEGDVASVGFRLFRRRDDAALRMLDPGGEVAIRAAGSCWQWKQEGACPPGKRCYASRWIRTGCGPSTMRNDVTVRFGFGPTNEQRARLVDARLVTGEGVVLWRTPLAAEFVDGYGESPASKQGRSPRRPPRIGYSLDGRRW